MSTNRLMYALLFLTVVAVNVDSICWNCMPENMSDEEIDTILADDFKRRILKKLGLTEEQIVAKNESTDLPLEIVNDLVADDEEEIKQDDGEGLLKSVILEALNNDTTAANTTSIFEYKNTDKLEKYRIEHVTLWLHITGNTSLYEVYEKISTLPRRMVFKDKYQDNVSNWKKITFVPSQAWLQNPLRKIRIEIQGVETPIVQRPLLQINVQRKKKHMKKRNARNSPGFPSTATSDCNPKDKTLCCRHTRTIPYRTLAPFVVAGGRNYRTNTCAGRCDPYHRNNNTWTFVSSVVQPIRSPCCVPTSFQPINVLVNVNGIIKRLLLKDFKVKTCGCA